MRDHVGEGSAGLLHSRFNKLRPWGQVWITAWFCAACRLRVVLTLLNGWENPKKIVAWYLIKIKWNSNFSSLSEVSLSYSHVHLFIYCLWPISCCNQSWAVVTETIWPTPPKAFTLWLFTTTLCQPLPYMIEMLFFTPSEKILSTSDYIPWHITLTLAFLMLSELNLFLFFSHL